MKRREFLRFAGTAGVYALPVGAHAQRRLPVIGFLNGQAPDSFLAQMQAFRKGLSEQGYVEGRDVTIEYRWAEGHIDRLQVLASELVQRNVSVIASTGGDPVALAVKQETSSLPIVFAIGGDPVSLHLVTSLNRPGGNVTGISQIAVLLDPKRLEALHELIPSVRTVAILRNPDNSNASSQLLSLEAAARAMGLELRFLTAANESQIDAVFESLNDRQVPALMVASDPFFNARRQQIVALSTRLGLPGIFHQREFALEGGLMSYGTSASDMYYRVGIYTGRILKGERPAELPVQQSDKVELVVNLKTAKKLGLAVPQTLLARADEVIE
jgi:putative ABC transport system substrate-binding protein